MLQQVLHEFEEVGLEPLDCDLREVDVKLRDGLTVNVVSTPLYDCACLKYVYANPMTGDEHMSVVYWPASKEPVVDNTFILHVCEKEYLYNLWPFDQSSVVTILDLKLMLLMLKQMLP